VIDVVADSEGLPAGERLEVLVDGRVAMGLASPYRGRLHVEPGDHLLEVRPADATRVALVGRAQFSVR
jgi:hypothetical protein